MRILKTTTSILAGVVFIAACSSTVQSTRAADSRAGGALAEARGEIQPLFERMLATANAHDVDGHLAAYTRDSTLVFVINDEIIRGWTALHERQRQWWQDGKSDAVYRVVGGPDYEMPAPGLVVQTYLLSSHRTLPDGAPSDGRIAVTDIWRKGPDGWRVIYAHESIGSPRSATPDSARASANDQPRDHGATGGAVVRAPVVRGTGSPGWSPASDP